jgi:glutaredoxin
VVIFSKTYCPYSKKAKGILLDKYHIDPDPYVVELDKHPQGAALQTVLYKTTGRRTVPNILVNGVSIGGGDDIADLDNQNKLEGKIKMLGNKRVKVSERFAPGESTL